MVSTIVFGLWFLETLVSKHSLELQCMHICISKNLKEYQSISLQEGSWSWQVAVPKKSVLKINVGLHFQAQAQPPVAMPLSHNSAIACNRIHGDHGLWMAMAYPSRIPSPADYECSSHPKNITTPVRYSEVCCSMVCAHSSQI